MINDKVLVVKCFFLIYNIYVEFIRARSKKQKDIRIDHVVKAAIKLYGAMPYEKISMATIAKEIDFTRGNLYRYFSTKHEIYLKVIEYDLRAYVKELKQAFKNKGKLPLEDFARLWAETFYKNRRLIELISIQYSVIEKNVTVDKLAEFKSALFKEMEEFYTIMKIQFPELKEDRLNDLTVGLQLFAMGLYPVTLQSDIQKRAVEKSGVPYKVPDFVDTFTRFIVFIAKGLGA